MTKRDSAARTSLRLLVFVWLSCVTSYRILAFAQPVPPYAPDIMYGESFVEGDTEIMILRNRLKQLEEQKHRMMEEEHEITDEQIEIKAILQMREMGQRSQLPLDYGTEGLESQPEMLPVPEPRVVDIPLTKKQASGKRKGKMNNYMSLCHFKICNMGRKRQSN